MIRLNILQTASEQRPEATGDMVAMAERLVLATVPAAWPTGVSPLAQAVDACQRYEPGHVGLDWLVRASGARLSHGVAASRGTQPSPAFT